MFVAGRAAHHHALLGNEILDVMEDKGGQPVEALELTRLRQGLQGLHLRQVAGGLHGRGLEQVTHFPVRLHRSPGLGQQHEALQLLPVRQWHDHPGFGDRIQPGG